jgi:hypothetical protein
MRHDTPHAPASSVHAGVDSIETGCLRPGSHGRWMPALGLALLLAHAGVAAAADRRVSTPGSDAGNDCTSSACRTITHAMGQAVAGDTIIVGYNQTGAITFSERVLIDKSVTIVGQGNNPSQPTYTSIVAPDSTGPALFTVRAPDVRIENLYFDVDFNNAYQGIRAESGGGADANGLVVSNVRLRARQNPANTLNYGQRNAIWINPASGPAISATVENSFVEGTPAQSTWFRAAIDARRAGLSATGNVLRSVNHDVYVAQHPPGVGVEIGTNTMLGFGVQYVAPLAGAGIALIDDNDFTPAPGLAGLVAPAPAGDFSAMRLIENTVGQSVTISNNSFAGHERGVLIQNFPGVALVGNSFTPLAGSSSFQHVVLSNKELFSNAVPPPPVAQSLALTATGNTFNAGTIAGGGIAVMLLNDNAQGEPPGGYYGTIDFDDNDFVGNLGRYFELGGFSCVSSNDPPCPLDALYSAVSASMPGTPVVKFAGDVDATGNRVNGTEIASLNPAQRSAVLARTRDSGFDSDLGTVDYGFSVVQDEVFVDAAYAGSIYGEELGFVHSQVNGGASYPVHFGITGFATLTDALAEVGDTGTIFVAAGTHVGATINRHVTIVGDDGSVNGDTVFTSTLEIAASGADVANRLVLRNLTATNAAGDGMRILGNRSFLHLDGISAVDNTGHGLMVYTNDGGLGDSLTTDLLITDSHFDRNGDPNDAGNASVLKAGLVFDEEASVQGLRIIDSSFDDNNGAGLSFNDIGAPSSTTSIDDVHISGSSFSRNNSIDGGIGGGGLWLKTSGAGSSITNVLVETSTFADNGTGQLNGGLVNRKINANGISVRVRPNTSIDNLVICANTFAENGGVGGTQEAGIYVFDDTLASNQGYQPVEVCASNVFTGLAYSVSGHEQRGARNTQPIVFITGGSFAPGTPAPEEINTGYVVNEDTLEEFRTINAAIADADTVPGHSIYAPAGLYHENVAFTKPDLTLRGEAGDRTLTIIDGRARSGSGVTFGVPVGVADSTLQDLTVRDFVLAGAGGACVHGPDGSDRTTIRNVLVHGCNGGRGGIFFAAGGDGVDGITIDQNEVHTTNERGIVVWDGLKTNITITGNYVHDLSGCCGIELQDGRASGVTVTGNTIRNVGDSGMSFIQLDGSAGRNLIAGNLIENFSGRFGIEIKIPNGTGVDDDNAVGAIVVRNNTIRHSGVSLETRDLAGIGVTRRAFIGQYGQVDVVTGVVVRNNTVHGFRQPFANEGHGIVIEGDQMRVFANTVYDNDVGIQRQAGNEPGSLPGDSNQAASNSYFSRGNAAAVCADLDANIFAGGTANGEDLRDVLPAGVLNAQAVVDNTTTGRQYCSLQAAIDDPQTIAGHVLELADDAVIVGQAIVNKTLRLTRSGDGTNAPLLRAPATVSDLALLRVAAPGVEIDSLNFEVDLARVAEAIRAVGNTAGGEPDGLSIHDNTITATASAGSFVSYPRRNAISLNMRVANGYAPAGEQVTTLTVDVRDNTIGGTQDWNPGAAGNQPAYFRSAIAIDQGEGTIAGNTLRGRDYDVFARFTNGAAGLDVGVTGAGNQFHGGGLYVGDGIADVRVTANQFAPDRGLLPFADFPAPVDAARWGDLGTSAVRLVNISDTVVLTGNSFSDHTNAVFAQNFADLDLIGNSFDAPGHGAEFRHLILSTKVLSNSGDDVAQVPLALEARANQFQGSAAHQAIAVELVNHDADAAQYGSIDFGGLVPADRNSFSGDFDAYFRLDPTDCAASNTCAPPPYAPFYGYGGFPATVIAPFGGNVEAANNTFDGTLPADMDLAQIEALQVRTYHDDPLAPEDPAAPTTLGRVNYGFAIDSLPTTTTIVSTVPAPSEVGQAVTVTVTVVNALDGVPAGVVVVTAPDSAGCTIPDFPTSTSCVIAGGFPTGGAKTVTAAFTADDPVNEASSDEAQHLVVFPTGTTIVVEPATVPTPADNDYTRINTAIQTAGPGVIVELDGSFDWNEPNALASWARGSNGIAAEGHIFATGGDDWSIRLRNGVNGVTVRAATPGAGIVLGNEGAATGDFSAFVVGYGTNQGWTFENLTLDGFDLGIGLYATQGESYNGTVIRANTVRIGPDSGDDYADYAIYTGYGEQQTIVDNIIEIDITGADGSATPGANSRHVGIQVGDSCNVDCFDGLEIQGNSVTVGGIPMSAPRVLGIWENAGDVNSSVTIDGNSFSGSGDLGGGVENNRQTAFIASTQSNGARLSRFRGNRAAGAAIGLQGQNPIFGHYVGSDAPLAIEGNTFLDNGTAISLAAAYPQPAKYVLRHNRIFGNVIGLLAERADDDPLPGAPGYGGVEQPSQIDADDNWWGCNDGPGNGACDGITVEAGADAAIVVQDTWLVLGAIATPAVLAAPGDTSVISADLNFNSDGDSIVGTFFPDGTPITLAATKGSLDPAGAQGTSGGAISADLDGHISGYSFVSATLDGETVVTTVVVPGAVTVSDGTGTHNDARATCAAPDFTTIQEAIDTVVEDTDILVCSGTYAENLLVDKRVALLGAQAGVDARGRAAAEALVVPESVPSGLSPTNQLGVLLTIAEPGVAVDGFTFDADNPLLDSGAVNNVGAANPDNAYGIYSIVGGTTVRNTVLRNVLGTAFFGAGTAGDNLFQFNRIANVGGRGVIAANNYYVSVLDNSIEAVRTGIQTNNNSQSNPGAPAVIARNAIQASSAGIFHNLFYAAASPWEIRENVITGFAAASETGQWRGLWIESMQSSQTVVVEANQIDGAAVDAARRTVGYLLNNITSDQAGSAQIAGGSVANVDVGVMATDAAFYTGPVNNFGVSGVGFSGIGLAALYVEDTVLNPGAATLTIGAGNSFALAPGAHTLALSGAGATVSGQAVADVLVRSERDFYFGAPVAGPPNTGVTPCLANVAPPYCVAASAVVNTGIAAATVGGTVTLEAGLFAQNVLANKSVNLVGPFAGVPGDDVSRGSGEAVIAPASGTALAFSANDVVIDGLEFGPVTHDRILTKTGGGTRTGVEFINNRLVDFTATEINSGGIIVGGTSGMRIEGNLFEDFANGSGFAMGLKLDGNTAPVVRDNVFRRVQSVAMQFSQATGADVDGNLVDGEAIGFTNAGIQVFTSSNVSIRDNVFNGTAQGLLFMRGNTGLSFTCNTVSDSTLGIRSAVFGTVGSEASPTAFHNVLPATGSIRNDWGSPLVVGSNFYGGAAAATSGAQPVFVADALPASPIGQAACGDNTATAHVLYPASGTPQSTDLNQPFAAPLRTRVQDALGGAVAGQSVTIAAPAAGASALLTPVAANGALPTLTTDYNGVVQVGAIANGFAGTYDVTASHVTGNLAFTLTNIALEQVLFDLNGPVGGVQVGDTVPYTGLIANSNPNLNENVRIRVQIGADSALDIGDVQLCVINPLDTAQCLPVTMTDDGATLSFDFPDVFGDLDGFDLTSPLPYEFLHDFRVVFGKAGVFTTQAQVIGIDTPTVYATDIITTEVIAQHAGVTLDLTGPVSGVEKDVPTAYSARLTNSAADVADNVVVEFVLTRTGGIQAGDITVEYDTGGGVFAAIPLSDATAGQLEGVFGPGAGFPLLSGHDVTTALRVTYHVAPHTFSVAATVIDATGDTDGVPSYAADNLSTEVIEADPDLTLTLSGLFDGGDGETLVAAFVDVPAIMRAELVNEGGDVPDLVQAAFSLAPDFNGIAATDVVATYWFVPSLASTCAPVPPGDRETVVFTVDGDNLVATTDPQPVTEDFELAVCFELEFLRPGVYNIGAVIEDAVPDTDGQSTYAADNLAVTVAASNATVALAGLGPFTFDGLSHAATATTSPPGLDVEITYSFENGPATNAAPIEAGTYAVTATVVAGQGYSGSASGTLTITPKPITLTLGGDAGGTYSYDGTARVASLLVSGVVPAYPLPVSPAPGAVQIRYDGSLTPPTDAGAYVVTAAFDPPSAVRNYVALPAIDSIEILRRTLAVEIDGSDLLQVFGDTRPVDASVTFPAPPAAQSVAALLVTYDGSNVAPGAVGSYAVVAEIIDPNYEGFATATLNIVAAALDRVELAPVGTTSAIVDSAFGGDADADVCALVTDVNEDPAANVGVTFSTPAGGASAALSANVVATDIDGLACVAAVANQTAGNYDITATVVGLAPDALGLTNFADADPAQVSLEIVAGNGQTAPVGEVFTVPLQVAASDRFGNVLTGLDLEPVFTAPASEPTAALSAATQNPDGSWQVVATAGDFAGAYAVQASIDDTLACDSGQCSVAFGLANTVAAPVDVGLVSDVASAVVGAPGGNYALTATVTDGPDGTGAGVSGVSVTFVVEPGVDGAGATSSNLVAVTDALGVANASFAANETAGGFAIRAVVSGVTVEGSTPDAVDLTNLAAAADTLAIVAGDNQSVAVGEDFLDLVVRVVDAFGNPVAGTEVSFAAIAAGNGASAVVAAAPVTSIADGTAGIAATANGIAGSYTVTASATGLDSVSFNLSNTLGSIAITNIRWAGNDATTIDYGAVDQLVAFDTAPAVDAADCSLSYNGSSTLPRDAGSWLVQVTCSNAGLSGTAGATLTIDPATVDVDLGDLAQVYDGSAKAASLTTTPAGIAGVQLAYSQSGNPVIAPIQAGSYDIAVSLDDDNYVLGTVTPAAPQLVIAPASVSLAFGDLSQVYDGSAKFASFTTTPAGVTGISLAYAQGVTPVATPTDAGSYTVEASLANPNYVLSGTTTATLTITQATAQIFLSNLTYLYDGTPKSVTVTTVPAGLAPSVVVTYNGSATAPSNVGNYAVVATLSGQQNYADASANATLSILAAAISQFVADSPSPVSGIAGAALDGADLPTVRVLDSNGNGVPSVNIVFEVNGGGGSASGLTVATDATGRATVGGWTLGRNAGTNTMRAQVVGLAGLSPVDFVADGEESAGIAVDKSSLTVEARPGDAITYTIVVSHVAGPSHAASVDILDELPEGLEVATASWSCAGTSNAQSEQATCNADDGLGNLDVSAFIPVATQVTITLTATVEDDAPIGDLVNSAVAELASSVETDVGDNEDDHTVLILPQAGQLDDIFEDGFEGDAQRVAAKSDAKRLGLGATARVVPQLPATGVPVRQFDVVAADGETLAEVDGLQIGAKVWYRVRHRDAAKVERFSGWKPLTSGELRFDWEADNASGALLRVGGSKQDEVLVGLGAAQAVPAAIRTRKARLD